MSLGPFTQKFQLDEKTDRQKDKMLVQHEQKSNMCNTLSKNLKMKKMFKYYQKIVILKKWKKYKKYLPRAKLESKL